MREIERDSICDWFWHRDRDSDWDWDWDWDSAQLWAVCQADERQPTTCFVSGILRKLFWVRFFFSLGTRDLRLASTCILCSFNLAARFLTHLRQGGRGYNSNKGNISNYNYNLIIDYVDLFPHLAEAAAAKGRDNGRAERRLATCLTQNKRTSRSPPLPTARTDSQLFALPLVRPPPSLPLVSRPGASFVCPFSTLVQFCRFVLSILMFSFLLLFIT